MFKKIPYIFLGLLIGFNAYAATLTTDITSQGRISYIEKTMTDQQLASSIRDYEDTTAANTLTYSECGKTIFLNSATEFATTLPAPVAGCTFKFIVKAAPSGASYTIVTASSANILIGHVETADVNTAAADGDSSTSDDTITIADGVAVVGDQIEFYSDGTSWYYIGHAKVYNGITAATVS